MTKPVNFNNNVYNIPIRNISHLNVADALFIQKTGQGFILNCESSQVDYRFTNQSHRSSHPQWRIACLMAHNHTVEYLLNATESHALSSLWETVDSHDRWLRLGQTLTISKRMYGIAAAIGSLALYCLTMIGLFFPVDDPSFSRRELKILAVSSFAATLLASFFVYDTHQVNAQTSRQVADQLVDLIQSMEIQEEQSRNHGDLDHEVTQLSHRVNETQAQIQDVKALLQSLLDEKQTGPSQPSYERHIPLYYQKL